MHRQTLALAILVNTVAIAAATAAPRTEYWYRGSFDGAVRIQDNPVPGYFYTPSRPTTYPLFEYRQSYPLPCDKCSHYHPAGAWCQQCGLQCQGNGSHIEKDKVYSPTPLQGQYYYKKQPHYNFRSPINVGPPYLKYNTPW